MASGSKVPNDGWIDRALNISGRPVTVSVRLLSEAERQAVAGEIAWLASAGAADGQALEHTVWCTLVNDVVARHVAFTVDESTGEELNSAWWGQAVEQATAALISVNHLEEAIRRLLARNFTPGKVNRMAS